MQIVIGGIKITPLSVDEAIADIIELLRKRNRQCQVITYLNAYVYCLARKNHELKGIISKSEIVLADGISILWAALILERIKVPRSVMNKVFDEFLVSLNVPECNCVLIGVTENEVKKAQENINKFSTNIKILEAYSGFHTTDYYTEILKQHSSIDLILIGMSSPKSEHICNLARAICNNSIVWHIGGGTIKCYAETKKRAPEWTSNLGIEWLHRFIFEKHTRKRYLIYNLMFIYFVLTEFIKSLSRIFIPSNNENRIN